MDSYLLQIPKHGSIFMPIFQLYSAVMELLPDPFNFPHHFDSVYVISIEFYAYTTLKHTENIPHVLKIDNLFGVTANIARVKIKRKTSSVKSPTQVVLEDRLLYT